MGEYTLCRYCAEFFDSDMNRADSCSFHPKLPVMIGNTGPREDYKDLYTYPCCGVTTLSDIDVDGRDVPPPQSPGCMKGLHVAETGWRVFISYARVDEQWVKQVEHELRRRGHRIWRDRSDLTGGESWAAEIDEAVSASDHFLLFLSDAAARSKQVARELALALELDRNVVPVLLEDCEIPESIRHVNCVDWRFVVPHEPGLFVIHQGFQQLRTAILFGPPTGVWRQAAEVNAADEEKRAERRREQQTRRESAVRQVVMVSDAGDGELLAELRLPQRYRWQNEQTFAIAGVIYTVRDVVEHSTASIDVVVERVARAEPTAEA